MFYYITYTNINTSFTNVSLIKQSLSLLYIIHSNAIYTHTHIHRHGGLVWLVVYFWREEEKQL